MSARSSCWARSLSASSRASLTMSARSYRGACRASSNCHAFRANGRLAALGGRVTKTRPRGLRAVRSGCVGWLFPFALCARRPLCRPAGRRASEHPRAAPRLARRSRCWWATDTPCLLAAPGACSACRRSSLRSARTSSSRSAATARFCMPRGSSRATACRSWASIAGASDFLTDVMPEDLVAQVDAALQGKLVAGSSARCLPRGSKGRTV